MGSTDRTLRLIFEANADKVSGALDAVEKKTAGLGSSFANMSKGAAVGMAGLGVAVAGVGVATLKVGMEFDDALDTLRAKTGATGPALDALGDSFRNVVGNVPEDIGVVSSVMAELSARTGQSGSDLEKLTEQTLALARVTGGDAQASVAGLTRMLGDASVPVKDQAAALDTVFKATQATGVGFDRLSELMVGFGAPMRNLGFTMEESAALLGKFEKEGVNTELVMGALKAASASWAKEGLKPIDGLTQTIAKIQELGPGAEATALAMETFGQKAGGDLVDTILGGKFAIDDLVKSIADSPETIATAADATAGFGEKFSEFKNKIKLAMEPAGTALLDGLTSAMESLEPKLPAITDAISTFAGVLSDKIANIDWDKVIGSAVGLFDKLGSVIGFIGDHPGFSKLLLAFGGIMAVLAPILSVVAPIISIFGTLIGIIGPLITAAGGLSTVLGVVATVLTGPVAIAIGVVVGAFLLWRAKGDEIKAWVGEFVAFIGEKWEAFKAVTTEKWEAAKEAVATRVEAMRVAIHEAWEKIKTAVSAALDFVKEVLTTAFELYYTLTVGTWLKIFEAIVKAWEKIHEAISTAVDKVKTFLSDAWDAIKQTIADKWDSFREVIAAAWEKIKAAVADGVALLKRLIELELAGIKAIFEGAFNIAETVRTKIGEVVTAVQTKIGEIVTAITGKAADILAAAKTLGTNIVQGVEDGINALKAGMQARIEALFDKLPQWVRNILESFSPSRVFMRIGADIVEGLIIGLDNGLKAVEAAAGRMGAAVTRGFARARMAGAGEFHFGGPPQIEGPSTPGVVGPGGFDTGFGNPQIWQRAARFPKPPGAMGNMNRTGKGGFIAASGANFWEKWVARNGGVFPEEKWAREVSAKMGLRIPKWLEDSWAPGSEAKVPGVPVMPPPAGSLAPGQLAPPGLPPPPVRVGGGGGTRPGTPPPGGTLIINGDVTVVATTDDSLDGILTSLGAWL